MQARGRLDTNWGLVNNLMLVSESGAPCGAVGDARDARLVNFDRISFGQINGGRMNKSELIDVMADAADISKSAAGRALDALTDSIAARLKHGETVSIIGFGTFSIKERAARTGRNPQTGDTIEIAASKTPSFKAGKALKDAVQ